MVTKTDVESLALEAERAEAKARAAREALERREAEEIAAYDARRDEFDRRLLDEYDAEAFEQKAKAAWRAFDQAVREGEDILRAWVAYRRAALIARETAQEVNAIAQRLDPSKVVPVPGLGAESLVDAVLQILDSVIGGQVADEMDDLQLRRERYAAGETDG